jgi:hypothetical protein
MWILTVWLAVRKKFHSRHRLDRRRLRRRAPVAEINVKEGVGVKGYDVVAYFTDRIPAKGSPEYRYQWKGATWQFGSAGPLSPPRRQRGAIPKEHMGRV